ncbi:hypothetical protein ACS7SF_17135 [Ralstonia sp. 25C]|uniref:hypothetical protein n=1 Tax=Ralstonia sp. 25C TaxID=3447363 RepID=UPI003F74B1D8
MLSNLKKTLLSTALAVFSLAVSVCGAADAHAQGKVPVDANQSQHAGVRLEEVNAQLHRLQAQQKALQSERKRDPVAFCYADDKAYSEGAALDNKVCSRQAADKLEASRRRPLIWR